MNYRDYNHSIVCLLYDTIYYIIGYCNFSSLIGTSVVQILYPIGYFTVYSEVLFIISVCTKHMCKWSTFP